MLSCDGKSSTAFFFPWYALQDFLSFCKATSHGRRVNAAVGSLQSLLQSVFSVWALLVPPQVRTAMKDAFPKPAGLRLCFPCPSLLHAPLAWPSPPSCHRVLPVVACPACHLLHSSSVTVGWLQFTTKHILWACFFFLALTTCFSTGDSAGTL